MTWRYSFAFLAAALAFSTAAAAQDYGPPEPAAATGVVSTQVFFPKSSAYLRKAEREKIREVADALGRLPATTLAIHGLTDPYGDPDFNDWLRNERSTIVKEALVSVGVDAGRLRLAEPRPSTAADQRQASHKLRRVEFSLDGLTIGRTENAQSEDAEEEEPAAPALGIATTARHVTDDHGPPHLASLALVQTTQVYFPKSSAYLRESEVAKLRQLALALGRLPGQTLSVRPLTDPRGDAAFNAWLRDERGTAVRKRLVALGVPDERMSDGAPRATASGATADSREKLRRVEFGIDGLRAGDNALAAAEADTEHSDPGMPVVVRQPPRYATIGRSERSRLGEVIAIAAATKVHFDFAGFRLRREYHRELWSLASAILETDDGAVSLKGYAAHGLPADEREEIGKRRMLSVAGMLQQMGVEWRRIRIEDEIGVSSPDDRPSWRDHRVEFTAIKSLPPEDLPAGEIASSDNAGDATGVELDATVAGSADPLATLIADTAIYFGGNSAKVRLSDKKKLKRIAAYALKDGETRTIAVTAVTDRWGNASYNRTLGERRQAAVVDLLHDAGLPPERAVEGAIETTPEGDRSPSWQQRRAELVLR